MGPGTISPLLGRRFHDDDDEAEDNDSDDHGVTPRLGVVLNWSPSMNLFVSEPFENRIAVLDITPDPKSLNAVFRVTGMHHIRSESLNQPVDLAPAVVETDDTNFSSNTSLDEGSDIYVANRAVSYLIRKRIFIPWYLVLFVVVAVVFSYVPMGTQVSKTVTSTYEVCFTAALVSIGMNANFLHVFKRLFKPLVLIMLVFLLDLGLWWLTHGLIRY